MLELDRAAGRSSALWERNTKREGALSCKHDVNVAACPASIPKPTNQFTHAQPDLFISGHHEQ